MQLVSVYRVVRSYIPQSRTMCRLSAPLCIRGKYTWAGSFAISVLAYVHGLHRHPPCVDTVYGGIPAIDSVESLKIRRRTQVSQSRRPP